MSAKNERTNDNSSQKEGKQMCKDYENGMLQSIFCKKYDLTNHYYKIFSKQCKAMGLKRGKGGIKQAFNDIIKEYMSEKNQKSSPNISNDSESEEESEEEIEKEKPRRKQVRQMKARRFLAK
jgi:predicted CopG family antitoxin